MGKREKKIMIWNNITVRDFPIGRVMLRGRAQSRGEGAQVQMASKFSAS